MKIKHLRRILSLIHIFVDALFEEIVNDLVDIIKKDEGTSEVLDMLMVAKYFERIGDHAVNIAEWVQFSITGEHKRL